MLDMNLGCDLDMLMHLVVGAPVYRQVECVQQPVLSVSGTEECPLNPVSSEVRHGVWGCVESSTSWKVEYQPGKGAKIGNFGLAGNPGEGGQVW